MAESTAITIKKFDGTDYKSWSLEIEILLEQKQVLGIVDGTEEAPWNRTVDYSPRDGEVIAAAVWRSERCKGTVGSAEGGLQVEGEAECLGFAR
jgi:hypothetical protein